MSKSSAVKVIAGTFDCTWWHSEHECWVPLSGVSGICIRNDSELASASLSASLVSFERCNSSCMVIRAGILASWANISKRKGMSSPLREGFFKTLSNRTSFCFSFPEVRTGAGTDTSTDVICCCVSLVVLSYCLKFDFPDLVPVGWGAASSAVKACFSFLESLREVIVILSSSGKTEITLQDLPFDLDFFESHCSSWASSECIHMISPIFNVKRTRPLISCCLTEGSFIFSRVSGIEKDPSGTVTFGVLPNSMVTLFAVTFFYSDFKVRTPASAKAWILSLRTKHMLVGWWTILWKRQ